MLDRTRVPPEPPRRKRAPPGYEKSNVNWDLSTAREAEIVVMSGDALREVKASYLALGRRRLDLLRAMGDEIRAKYLT